MLRALGEAELTLFYYVSLWPVDWVNAAPWHALVIAGILSVYYAIVRLILGRRYAKFFDISSIGAIVLWIGFWPYELHMQAWEKTVTAPIRIDLIFLAIVLGSATIISLLSSWWSLFRKVNRQYRPCLRHVSNCPRTALTLTLSQGERGPRKEPSLKGRGD
jgi:hypothetical protein